MTRTNKERVLDYIWAVSPAGATNSQIQRGTDISSHQQVYLLTRELAGAGQIRGERRGRENVFWVDESVGAQLSSPGRSAPGWMHEQTLTPQAFAKLACSKMSAYPGIPLTPGRVADVPWASDNQMPPHPPKP